jgi:2-oxo-4-hydroxy-4-carboxy--5-ureidoimidazoline (OHCU) decarboxylase
VNLELIQIDALNALSGGAFAAALTPLFEAAAPLAGALYAMRPFTSYAAMIDSAECLTSSMPEHEQVVVLAAHPPIGADPTTVSAASFHEQGYSAEAREDAVTLAAIYAQLASLNTEYERRFGFRFVVFVDGRSKAEILEVLRSRLQNTRDIELTSGVQAMFAIARARLAASARIGTTRVRDDDPARLAILEELRRGAVETYGEDRAGEAPLHAALQAAATAVWRVIQEPLEPSGNEP